MPTTAIMSAIDSVSALNIVFATSPGHSLGPVAHALFQDA